MIPYDPVFRFFGRFFEPLGYSGGIISRKLQLVYVHWTIWIAFLGATWLVYRRSINNPKFPKSVLPIPALIAMSIYSLVAGFTFFNKGFFSHYMFHWPVYMRFQSMLWSLLVVAMPMGLIYLIVSIIRKDFLGQLLPFTFMFFVFHAATTVVYLLCPFVAVE